MLPPKQTMPNRRPPMQSGPKPTAKPMPDKTQPKKKTPLAAKQFQAPIPGQSLVAPPRGKPYERPPQVVDPEGLIQQITARLSNEERMGALFDLLETGVPIYTATKGVLRKAVAEGFTSIDAAMAVAPAIHEFIKSSADIAGVDYEEGLEKRVDPKQEEDIIFAKAMYKARKQTGEVPQGEVPVEEVISGAEEGPSPDGPRGFMERRTV